MRKTAADSVWLRPSCTTTNDCGSCTSIPAAINRSRPASDWLDANFNRLRRSWRSRNCTDPQHNRHCASKTTITAARCCRRIRDSPSRPPAIRGRAGARPHRSRSGLRRHTRSPIRPETSACQPVKQGCVKLHAQVPRLCQGKFQSCGSQTLVQAESRSRLQSRAHRAGGKVARPGLLRAAGIEFEFECRIRRRARQTKQAAQQSP